MVQVKKDAVRQRIIETADLLFQRDGYMAATMSQIAKRARVASSTIYVYFPSKFAVAFAIFEPWLIEQVNRTQIEARKIASYRRRLEYVLTRLWHDIPLERDNYLNSLMQALAISTRDDYQPTLLFKLRDQIRKLISDCLPEERLTQFDTASFAHLAVMAFDGFVINGHLNPSAMDDGRIIKAACDMILGEPSQAGPVKADPPRPTISRKRK